MHFFSPANVMKLLEVVRGAQTADDVLVTAMAVGQRVGKTCVVARVCDGFIGNRMLASYRDAAYDLLQRGATPAEIDGAVEGFGFAMGPFRMGDLAGNDIGWAIRKRRYAEDPTLPRDEIADALCEAGPVRAEDRCRLVRLRGTQRRAQPRGRRSARGSTGAVTVFRARPSTRRRSCNGWCSPSPTPARGSSTRESRCARRTSTWCICSGTAFPRHEGGPMHYANRVGLPAVVDGAAPLPRVDWQPAPTAGAAGPRGRQVRLSAPLRQPGLGLGLRAAARRTTTRVRRW
jgi:3-hydroxyacyl-CoA dehydrogenase